MDTNNFALDDQAKWDFLKEVDRYHRKLRQMEDTQSDNAPEALREASQEHLHRVTDIYTHLNARQREPQMWNGTSSFH